MDPITAKLMSAAAAAGAGAASTYVDDVFSTFLYDGNGSSQTIINGIDLSGEGGFVWGKAREWNAYAAHIVDTERGATKYLDTSSTLAEGTDTQGLTAFTSSGFSVGSSSNWNVSGTFNKQVSWTFRKCPKFCTVVTYTGAAANETTGVTHDLGSVPGMMITRRLDTASGWTVWHKSMSQTDYLYLDENFAKNNYGSVSYFTATAPTSSKFFLHQTNSWVNGSGGSYVAYLFADNEAAFGENSDEPIIKCGSYSGNGSSSGPSVNLGFEPQWLLIKNTGSASNWVLLDSQRGIYDGSNDPYLSPNSIDEEKTSLDAIKLTPTGFDIQSSDNLVNTNGDAYIYVAIRRPHKPPSAGTEVFDDVAYTGNASTQDISISPSLADSVLIKRSTSGTDNWGWVNRLTGPLQHLTPNSSAAEATRNAADAVELDRQSAFGLVGSSSGEVNASSADLISYSFKRAPGFFDIAIFEGNGSAQALNHNLAAIPELMIVKSRGSDGWKVYHKDSGNTKYLFLHTNDAESTGSTIWNNTSPTSTQFTVGTDSSASGVSYLAYLFASSGICKVGSYTGTGSNLNVDCGFSAGARFVLIKRSDSSGDWYVWDTARGIVAGNDPYLQLNTTDAQVTNTDYIDPLNSGFTVTSSAPAALNASGGTYIFLAIA